MKFLFLLVSLIVLPSQDIQKQVEQSVKKYIVENADDPKGFQVVSFGKAEKFMTSYLMTKQCKFYMDMAKMCKENAEKYPDSKERWAKDAKDYVDKIEANMGIYKPSQFGWRALVKYRLKNEFGLLKLNEQYFYLDKTFKVVSLQEIELEN